MYSCVAFLQRQLVSKDYVAYRLNNQTIILLFVVGEMRVIRSLLAFVAVRGEHAAATAGTAGILPCQGTGP